MSNKMQELVVCKNFRLMKKLGTGAFGEIYLAENKTNPQQKFAAKLEETSTKFPQLYFESKMYKYLHSFGAAPGIPKVYAVTTEGQYNVMLMDLLGSSLEDLFVEQGKKMSLKSVLMVGEQMVQRIELLHEKNILHRDVKPDNFLMGIGKQAHVLYLVDLGLSKKYIHDNKHIPYKEGKELTGTARYASINTHMGIEQSRRDDIEAVGYVLMYLLRGILPWQNMKAKDTKAKYKLIMEKKIATPAEFLCKGFPNELASFINYAKGLKFEQRPDYKFLKSLLVSARKSAKIECDYQYDWTHPTLHTNVLSMDFPAKIEKMEPPPKVEYRQEAKRPELTQQESNLQVAGSLIRQQSREQSKLSSNNRITQNAKNGVLSSAGLETIATKVPAPKISVIKR